MIWKMSGIKGAIVSEDLTIYFRRSLANRVEETFFKYSNYLSTENFLCIEGFKELITL
jgi:hypothetical protein